MMASVRGCDEGVPNIVMIGVPNLSALNRVQSKLRANQIPHFSWIEPDNDLGFTAICTSPLREDKRTVLRNYRVYHSPVTEQSANFVTEGRGANTQVAQLRERLVLSGEVEGENPSLGTNL